MCGHVCLYELSLFFLYVTLYMNRVDWMEWGGSKFRHSDFVVRGFQEADAPQFGKIYDILF